LQECKQCIKQIYVPVPTVREVCDGWMRCKEETILGICKAKHVHGLDTADIVDP
jgi:hypothetical protein